jgi:hypothetical protein
MTTTTVHLNCYVGLLLMEHFNEWVQAGKIESIVIKDGIVKIVTEDGKDHHFYADGLEVTMDGVKLPGDRPHKGLIPFP